MMTQIDCIRPNLYNAVEIDYCFYFTVVIMCAAPSKVREILLAAEKLGMMERGEYVFLNVELFTR